MNRGILFAAVAALALGHACRQPADPGAVQAVDSLITRVEAAILTLNELDHGRYARAEAVFRSDAPRYEERFKDTLDRHTALILGNHYKVLRAAGPMGREHQQVHADLGRTLDRLKALRTDLGTTAVDRKEAPSVLARERQQVATLDTLVHVVIQNYRSVQQAWDDLDEVEPLLASRASSTSRP